MKEQCKKTVFGERVTSWRCTRKAWKDGYCKQHHPETVKARHDKSIREWREKRERKERRNKAHDSLYKAKEEKRTYGKVMKRWLDLCRENRAGAFSDVIREMMNDVETRITMLKEELKDGP